jgi:hypothetical protein
MTKKYLSEKIIVSNIFNEMPGEPELQLWDVVSTEYSKNFFLSDRNWPEEYFDKTPQIFAPRIQNGNTDEPLVMENNL